MRAAGDHWFRLTLTFEQIGDAAIARHVLGERTRANDCAGRGVPLVITARERDITLRAMRAHQAAAN